MAHLIKDVDGKTIVQVKVPVCITIQMNEADAKGMTHDELCGLVDEAIDQAEAATGIIDALLPPRRWMNSVPIRFSIARHWDELPVDECDIMSSEVGLFEYADEDETGCEDE